MTLDAYKLERFARLAAHWGRMSQSYMAGDIRGPMTAQAAKDLQEILALTEVPVGRLGDDGHAIDEAWLEQIGFERTPETHVLKFHDLRMFEFRAYKMVALEGSDHFEMKTRGEVRRLCEALKIQTKESV